MEVLLQGKNNRVFERTKITLSGKDSDPLELSWKELGFTY